ncbi:MAG TPA: hypothetical protein VGG75_07145 [Trebonia sp.]|jgi:hypothetical protein
MLLLRELVCARAWLAVIHHVAGVLTGVLLAFCAAFVAAGLAGLPLALLGLPLLGLGLRLTGWGARFERARFAITLGEPVPGLAVRGAGRVPAAAAAPAWRPTATS